MIFFKLKCVSMKTKDMLNAGDYVYSIDTTNMETIADGKLIKECVLRTTKTQAELDCGKKLYRVSTEGDGRFLQVSVAGVRQIMYWNVETPELKERYEYQREVQKIIDCFGSRVSQIHIKIALLFRRGKHKSKFTIEHLKIISSLIDMAENEDF